MHPQLNSLLHLLETELFPHWHLHSEEPTEPVQANHIPAGWQLLGCGNYAAVVVHHDFPQWVVKCYAPGRPGLAEEAAVYRKLGEHRAFSRCLYVGDGYLVLQRLHGKTLWQCCLDGTPILPQAIADIDEALIWAQRHGLYPHDVHAKNVMQHEGRGLIVDISDFYKNEPCANWRDFKRAYRYLYRPLLGWKAVALPEWLLNGIRRSYRKLKRLRRLILAKDRV